MGCDLARTEPLSGTVGRQTQFATRCLPASPCRGRSDIPQSYQPQRTGNTQGLFFRTGGKGTGFGLQNLGLTGNDYFIVPGENSLGTRETACSQKHHALSSSKVGFKWQSYCFFF